MADMPRDTPARAQADVVWLQALVSRMPELDREELEGTLHERLYQLERAQEPASGGKDGGT